MKKQFTIFLISIFVLGILTKVDAEILTPNIASITPASFSAMETINIIGSDFGNFENGSYYNRICFGYGEGEIISWNNNEISVEVPDSVYNTNYGNELGIYTIQDNASYGVSCGSAEGKRSNYFTNYTIKPRIDFFPSKIMLGWTTYVDGEGFGYAQGTVLVNGMCCRKAKMSRFIEKLECPSFPQKFKN